MHALDKLLIEKLYSPFAGWLKHRIGLCQWRAALLALNTSIALYVAGVGLEIANKGPADPIWLTMIRALVWLLVLDFARRVANRQAASSVGVRTAREREWFFRAILLVALPFTASVLTTLCNALYAGSLVFLITHLYLKASDTPPPAVRGRFAYNRG